MTELPLPTIRLQPQRHKRVRSGHPWAYSNEIEMTDAAKALAPGSLVRLTDSVNAPLGVAMFNPHTLIAARLLTRRDGVPIDRDFLYARLARALALRDRQYDAPYYRLVHAEADALPGLIVDRMGDVAVVEIGTAGMDRLAAPLLEALDGLLSPCAVVLRNDSPARLLEGLAVETRLAAGALDGPVTVIENGARFFAEPLSGQKTGWFYDQRESRARVAHLASGARVLDLYCYLGGFGIQAALAGAADVVGVDRSAPALALAARSAAENGVGAQCRFVRAEAFAEMERLAAAGEVFDIVVADPPAFVKSRKDLGAGLRGYRKMMRLALRLVAPGGLLFVASCSYLVDAADFAAALRQALNDARRDGRILAAGGAGPDHPVHPFVPETAYLKSLLLALD